MNEMGHPDKILQFYDTNVIKEWGRLFSDKYHQVEYYVTLHYLDKYLPTTHRILDAGGGPGRYTIYLANKGHRMTLVDISPKELNLAKAKIAEHNVGYNVELVTAANILDLSLFPDNRFTSTIALGGVLSHFVDEQDRKKAVSELSRVTRPDGLIFISVMNRFGEISNTLLNFPGSADLTDQFLLDGNHKRPMTGESTGTHFYTPNELVDLTKQTGLTIESIVSVQNIASPLRNYVNGLTEEQFQQWLKVFIHLSQEPSLLGISSHLLIIAKNTKKVT
ncbi:MAG: hypothetical protein A3H50_01650 [Candidatus Levybacteria bacterium RIFCSPLOWO2_02_FULL_37_10]|uniref:Methyltransferase domain-containing protein n=1 Tax=Candidatus Blackburnbacteria bacterium RIFCSPLOWO2_01_FULL_41_27 TaxID=1797520 RepID=A0A1G1VCS0_9BACT|nr:MAG: hypothetical protein A3C97_00560 [Candidatus Levybacteria bacterium RIFCSPHIGHO2_02_FULL_37_11]OGH30139.1 MAG: hypothetical protein A3F30_00595 [Candidatus Levybacteria bacterium RIFCSPHIGHO2_12_FULL_37_12]OGH44153.1 MAG: hypothetical protein A3H50_01650 [Candidatus Levybacteria bacterium RIFCSPLOWO2_02_FULL_37_10]OGY13189.1 MAG: hypothetical protein A3A58_02055 [Candidatus Blackburnbacteria bacterium RIFCSPLOWO2_01_FULL_41_27]